MIDWPVLVTAALITGVCAGTISGLLGVGGGIVMVPVLDTALTLVGTPPDLSIKVAVATSLATIVPTSIASARAHHRRGAVDVALAKRWAPSIVVGALLGGVFASYSHGKVLTAVFGGVALLAAIKMLLPLENKTLTRDVPRGFVASLIPTTIGAVSSMMGIGGGTLSVPTLTLMNLPVHRAVGTANLLGLAIAVPGTLAYLLAQTGDAVLPPGTVGLVSLVGLALIMPTTLLLAPLGARLAHLLSRRVLSAVFGGFLLIVAARMLYRTLI